MKHSTKRRHYNGKFCEVKTGREKESERQGRGWVDRGSRVVSRRNVGRGGSIAAAGDRFVSGENAVNECARARAGVPKTSVDSSTAYTHTPRKRSYFVIPPARFVAKLCAAGGSTRRRAATRARASLGPE